MIHSLFSFPNKRKTIKKNLDYDFLGYPNVSMGKYIGSTCSNSTSLLFNAGTVYFAPIYIYKKTTFDGIAIRGNSTTAGAVVRLGIYDAGPNDRPSSLLLDAGTISGVTINTTHTISIDISLDKGMYYLASFNNGSNATLAAAFSAVSVGNSRFHTANLNIIRTGCMLTGHSGNIFPVITNNIDFDNNIRNYPVTGLRIKK